MRPLKIAPKRVPVIYPPMTPRPSAESRPYRSATIAKDPSREIEKLVPTASRPMRNTNIATGKERRIVPRLPNSCKISAGPAERILGKLGPIFVPILAVKYMTAKPIKGEAVSISLRSTKRSTGKNIPITNAYSMGSNSTVPGPTWKRLMPINSAIITITNAKRCTLSSLLPLIFELPPSTQTVQETQPQ